jgi:uncharacterized repeat protein (TIGR02543 family)
MSFTLNATCYSLTTNIDPSGAGSLTAVPAPNCGGQYSAGTVVKLTRTTNPGYTFINWSGDASGTASSVYVTMDGDKSVTANFRNPVVLVSPFSPPELTSWNNVFRWAGVSAADDYFLEVYDASNTRILYQRFSKSAAGCATDLDCEVSPASLATLANGTYTWRVRDYASTYYYGLWTAPMSFTLNQ